MCSLMVRFQQIRHSRTLLIEPTIDPWSVQKASLDGLHVAWGPVAVRLAIFWKQDCGPRYHYEQEVLETRTISAANYTVSYTCTLRSAGKCCVSFPAFFARANAAVAF